MNKTISEGKLPSTKKKYKHKKRKLLFTESKKNVKCDVCPMKFRTIVVQKKHMLVHSDYKQFSCEVKHKLLKIDESFHVREELSATAQLECLWICSKEFRRNDHLKSHIPTHFKGYGLTKHDFATTPLNVLCFQYKPILQMTTFICAICSKEFPSAERLRDHATKHSISRPYCCEICSKAFKRPSFLRNHFKNCHPKYLHNHRDYSYIDETIVEDHANKKYHCDMCSKGFDCRDTLKLHLFSHFNIRPFDCKICSKGFPSKPQLRKHLRKHMDREPNTPVTQLTVSEQEVYSDEELITPVTQVTVCKEEVDIDEPNTHVTPLTVFKQEVDCDYSCDTVTTVYARNNRASLDQNV